ncbi:MAG: DNA internalization-related competence protein ComEC/Rec2 [Gammaproteobacteria bacterium]|nr:DNA internalization-related competence protein ComEC/Rec2 [Gammaproteobacteria bacterium]
MRLVHAAFAGHSRAVWRRFDLPLVAVGFLAGSAAVFALPQLLPDALVILVAALTIALAAWRRTPAAMFAATLLAGFAWTHIVAHRQLVGLPLEGTLDTQVVVRVADVVQRDGSTLGFVAEAKLPGAGLRRVWLRWYEFPAGVTPPRPGDLWQLDVRLRAPHGLANPGRRFRADFAFRSGLAASGYVRGSENRRIATGSTLLLASQRDRLSRQLAAGLKSDTGGALVVALAIGDRQHLSDGHWQVLRNTGLSHLVAISGLHIGIVAGLGYLGGTLLGGLSRRGILLGCGLSALLAVGYAALAGFTIPTRRALLVVLVLLLCRLSRRDARPAQALAAALLLVLVFDPLAPLEAGFWLSFFAVVVLLYAGGGDGSWLRRLWSAQLAVFVGLAPLLSLLFGQVALAAPLVNLMLLPLFSLVLIPLVLGGVVVFFLHAETGLLVLARAAALLDGVWPALQWVANFEALVYYPAHVPASVLFIAVIGSAWLLAPRGWPARWLGLLMLLPAVLPADHRPAPGAFELTMLDVGHGLAIVVRTRRHVLLYDTGPRWRSGRSAYSSAIRPFLRLQGNAAVDRVVVSHSDNDHAGGLDEVLADFPAARVLGSGVANKVRCQRGQRWFWDGLAFDVLHPPAGDGWTGNDASCVVRISNGKSCVLLTGDIEAAAERNLVARRYDRLRCALLAAPHHGSKTSSTAGFVAATGASHVLVSVNKTNQWGLPGATVVQRWQDAGAAVYLTANAGAISAHVSRHGEIGISRHRCRNARFWRPRCALVQPGR